MPSDRPRSSGDSIQRWAVAADEWETTVWSASSFSRAERMPPGSRVSSTALASARLSRFRDSAALSSIPAGRAMR